MAKPTYFSTLVVDELLAVAKSPFFGDQRFVDFWLRGPFAPAVPHLFRTITLGTGDLPLANLRAGELYIGLATDLRELYRVCGQVFTRVNIDPNFYPWFGEQDFDHLESLFKTGASLNLSSGRFGCIEYYPTLAPLVRKLGENFASLTARSSHQKEARGIPKDLLDSFASWNNLTVFSYTGRDPAVLSPIWKKSNCLEDIEIRIEGDEKMDGKWKSLLHDVGQNCRKLTRIYLTAPLSDNEVSRDQYVNFLTSYGEKLVDACLHSFGREHLEKVAKSCVNLRCRYIEYDRLDRIATLGRHIRNLILWIPVVEPWESITSAFHQVNALEELSLMMPSIEIVPDLFTALFSKGMDGVKKLSIFSKLTAGHLKSIALKIKYLQELDIVGMDKIDGRGLKSVIEANPNLSTLRIKEDLDENDEIEKTVGLMKELVEIIQHRNISAKINFANRGIPPDYELHKLSLHSKFSKSILEFSFKGTDSFLWGSKYGFKSNTME